MVYHRSLPSMLLCIVAGLMALAAAGCSSGDGGNVLDAGETAAATVGSDAASTVTAAAIVLTPNTAVVPSPTTVVTPTPLPTLEPVYPLVGIVTTADGQALPNTTVMLGNREVTTNGEGRFLLGAGAPGLVTFSRPAWEPLEVEWTGSPTPLEITLAPRVVRALRVSAYSELTDERFDALLELAAASSVNALVFDTKDESGHVRYETDVDLAHELGAIQVAYDPVAAIEQAKAAGLYTITRIVSFEDPIRANGQPSSRAVSKWIDAANPDNWTYNLDLAVEACGFGFDEIQFDYVRFPTGVAGYARPATQEERVGWIVDYLTAARTLLHPMGCAISADIFGIVLSSVDDQGIGQVPEDLSEVVDVLSPMVYPSHYGEGWLGYAYPNEHNAAVTADALDDGAARISGTSILRPWLQAFWYQPAEIRAGIDVTDDRGMGWLLWEAGGSYSAASLPAAELN